MRWQNIFSMLFKKKPQSFNFCPICSICNCQVTSTILSMQWIVTFLKITKMNMLVDETILLPFVLFKSFSNVHSIFLWCKKKFCCFLNYFQPCILGAFFNQREIKPSSKQMVTVFTLQLFLHNHRLVILLLGCNMPARGQCWNEWHSQNTLQWTGVYPFRHFFKLHFFPFSI